MEVSVKAGRNPPIYGHRQDGRRGRLLTGILYKHLSNCGWRQVPEQYAHHRSLCEYQNKWLENGLWKLLQLRSAMYAEQPAHERYLTLCKEYSRTRERHARKLAFQDYRDPASDHESNDVSADLSDPVSIDEAGSPKNKANRPRVRLRRKRRRTKEQLNEQVKQAIRELDG